MTFEEYRKTAAEQDDWAPGWDAVEAAFETVYPGQKPSHYGTDFAKRAMFGGDQYLDGYSIYTSSKGYKHIVTFGMSELYTNEEAFGKEFSRWGYEMTIKLPADNDQDCLWAIDMLSNLARYTFRQQRYFEPLQFISGGGQPIKIGSDSSLCGLLVMNDPEIPGVDTVHGRVDFLQLVGITRAELDALTEDRNRAAALQAGLAALDPSLVTDLDRRISIPL